MDDVGGPSDSPTGPAQALAALAAAAQRRLAQNRSVQPVRLLVAAGSCGVAVGAAAVAEQLRQEVATAGLRVGVIEAACTGMCYQAVQVTLQRPGQPDVTWGRVKPGQAPAILEVASGRRPAATLPGAFAWSHEPADELIGIEGMSFLAGQRRILLDHVGRADPTSIDEALAHGGYRGLARALAGTPANVIEIVKQAKLTGRGGAYFLAGVKWEGCRNASGAPRYLVVNAEEGEPGVFKDRHLLEGDPHLVIEGILIAAYAIGAERVFIYVNGQAKVAKGRLVNALQQAEAIGLLGEHILGTTFSCHAEIREGGGGYVLGEETVLLESIEGRRSMPRIRPPYPVTAGLWERPTVVDNVETLANVPLILERGARWFTSLGTPRWPGTKLIAVTGDVARPGLVEVPIGTSVRRVLFDLAGGIPGEQPLQAVLTGGPSGNLVPPDRLDTPLEPKLPDVMLGSGNLIALDATRSLLEVIRRLTRFNAEESCGKCTPCREGVSRMREILDRIARGQPRPNDREDLRELGDIAAAASICGLGQMAPNPVLSALRSFRVMSDA